MLINYSFLAKNKEILKNLKICLTVFFYKLRPIILRCLVNDKIKFVQIIGDYLFLAFFADNYAN